MSEVLSAPIPARERSFCASAGDYSGRAILDASSRDRLTAQRGTRRMDFENEERHLGDDRRRFRGRGASFKLFSSRAMARSRAHDR